MTEEKVKKGADLLLKLKHLKEDRKMWKSGVLLHRLELSCKYDYISSNDVYPVRCSCVNFKRLQEDTLANIDRMIAETQKEFDRL